MNKVAASDLLGQLKGLDFKIGRFGKAYYWCNGEWIASADTVEDIKRQISKDRERRNKLWAI